MASETVPRRLLTSEGQAFERDVLGCLALNASRHGTRLSGEMLASARIFDKRGSKWKKEKNWLPKQFRADRWQAGVKRARRRQSLGGGQAIQANLRRWHLKKKKKDLRRVKVAKAWENFSRSQFFFFKFSASGRETLLKFGMLAVIFDVICCDWLFWQIYHCQF